MMNTPCPCGSDQSYSDCCGLYIDAHQLAETPEQLMRSRYTAFTQANIDYIQATMRKAAAKHTDLEQSREWAKSVQWLGLEVLHSEFNEHKGLVEFKAHYSHQDKEHVIHERSLFEQINGKWFYTGEAPKQNTNKAGRNDPCPCGSNKKYKKCCL